MDEYQECGKCGLRQALFDADRGGFVCQCCGHVTRPAMPTPVPVPDSELIWPGTRVEVWDSVHGKRRPGVVVHRYGMRMYRSGTLMMGPYADCVDVRFDGGFFRPGDNEVSRGHFTYGAKVLA